MKHNGAIALLTVLRCAVTGTLAAANDRPAGPLCGLNDSGVQLHRTRQYLEWQRTQEKIAEGRKAAKVEQEASTDAAATEQGIRFILQGVTTDTTAVLQPADTETVTKDYVEKESSLSDITL